MLFTEVVGRKVVSTSSAETVGLIAHLVVDPQSRAVVALHLKKTESGDIVLWSNILAFGSDAVTVADAEVVTETNETVAELAGKDRRVLGKRVLTTAGQELGAITDVDFDPDTGSVTSLLAASRVVAGDRLVGVGSYAVVVHDLS